MLTKMTKYLAASLLLAGFSSLNAAVAQDLFALYTEQVKPNKTAEFISLLKKRNEIYQQHKLQTPYINTFGNDELKIYQTTPIKNLADLDTLLNDIRRVEKAYGEDKYREEIDTPHSQTINSWNLSVIRYLPQLSYRVDKVIAEHRFMKVADYVVQPDHYAAFVQAAEEVKAFYEKHNYPLSYYVYTRYLGSEISDFMVTIMAKDEQDFATQDGDFRNNLNDDLKEELKGIASRVSSATEGWQWGNARRIPSASYVAE